MLKKTVGKLVNTILRLFPAAHPVPRFIRMLIVTYKNRGFKTLLFSPPGHFYSPLPNLNQLDNDSETIFCTKKHVADVDMRVNEQLELLDIFTNYYDDIPFKEKKISRLRYYYDNPIFGYADGIILYSMLRHFKPRNIVEVGAGFSSAVMLDTNDLFLEKSVKFTFVEPYPDRLHTLLSDLDRENCDIIKKPVQNAPLDSFKALEEGDILFIDSSHVVKTGSDVLYLFSEILPVLRSGVIIHFHDIFWPFEYPKKWLMDGISWNEAYFLRTFLQNNDSYKIVFFNSYIAQFHKDKLSTSLPLCMHNTGGSIWLMKV